MQPIDESVLTPFGWKEVGLLNVGDKVCNPDGTVSEIVVLSGIQTLPTNTLKFHDSTQTQAGPEHLWNVWVARDSRKIGNIEVGGEASAQVITTGMIANVLARGKKPLIPVTKEVAFNVTRRWKCGMDPYLLGLILGDGHIHDPIRHGDSTGITSDDHEHIIQYLDLIGADYRIGEKCGTTACSYCFRNEFHAKVKDQLRRVKLLGTKSGTKFIPDEYKMGTVDVRYALVCGLMDTDGYVDERGQVYYCTTSPQLSEDMAFVLRSLGAVVTVYKKDTGENHALAYEHYIKHRNPEKLFKLPRKRDRVIVGRTDVMFKRVDCIQISDPVPMRSLKVNNPNGLYITRDFILTHNSLLS